MAHPRAVSSYDSSNLSVDGEAMYHVGHFLGGGHAGTVHECEHIATGQVSRSMNVLVLSAACPNPAHAAHRFGVSKAVAAYFTADFYVMIAGMRCENHESHLIPTHSCRCPSALQYNGQGMSLCLALMPFLAMSAKITVYIDTGRSAG